MKNKAVVFSIMFAFVFSALNMRDCTCASPLTDHELQIQASHSCCPDSNLPCCKTKCLMSNTVSDPVLSKAALLSESISKNQICDLFDRAQHQDSVTLDSNKSAVSTPLALIPLSPLSSSSSTLLS